MTGGDRAGSADLGPVARRLAASQRVLVVEDEEDIATFLRAYFRASGYDLVHVDPDNSQEVIAALDEHQPDCVLLDLRLRGFRGDDAYRRIRAYERFAFVPVIVVSAEPPDPPIGTGIDGYVAKPFNVNTLAEVVKDHVARARELAADRTGHDIGVVSDTYLRARLADEAATSLRTGEPLSFALVRIRSLADVRAVVGDEQMDDVLRSLVEAARDALPDSTVLGRTDDGEIAVLLPGAEGPDARSVLASALDAIAGPRTMAGGAEFVVTLGAGLATFPTHADDADELYMAADVALTDACDRNERLAVAG